MHKWSLIIYFCTVYIGIQIHALHRIKRNDSISDSRNQSMIVNDFVRIRDPEVLDLTNKNISFTDITKLANIDSNSITNHLNISSSKTPITFKDDIKNHLRLLSVDKKTNLSSKTVNAFPHPYMNHQLKPSVNSHSLQLPNSTKIKKQIKVPQIPKQEMKYHNYKIINRNILSSNINGNTKNYAFNNSNGQNNNNINEEGSNIIEYNIKNKMNNQETINNGINDNYIKLNKIQNNSNTKTLDGNKNNVTDEGTCINDRHDDNSKYSKLINLSDNNHASKQQSLQPQINKFNKQQVQSLQQIYPQETISIQKQCQENKDKFNPIENILRFANMLLYKVNPDTPVYKQGRQFINYPNMNHNLNNPIKELNSLPNIISVQSKSNPTDTNIDSIDYLYNTMDTLPYLHALTGVTGTSTNINRPFILQSHMGVNDLPQSFNIFEDALDLLLNADEDDDEIELRCPVHHEIKNVGENSAIGNEERNGLMQVCSCRLIKKKKSSN